MEMITIKIEKSLSEWVMKNYLEACQKEGITKPTWNELFLAWQKQTKENLS